MNSTIPQNVSLGALLQARALKATQRRLVLDVLVGTAAALALFWFQPRAWIALTCAALCFVCYGVWALAERNLELGPDDMSLWEERVLSAIRVLAAIAGLACALVVVFSVISRMFGTWIS